MLEESFSEDDTVIDDLNEMSEDTLFSKIRL